MENLPRNLEKDVIFFTPPKFSKQKKKWTLILLGDHGEIINVEWLKGAALAGMLFLIAALAAATYFYFLYTNAVYENRGVHGLTDAQQRAAPSTAGEDISLPAAAAPEPNVRSKPAPDLLPPETSGAESPADKTAAASKEKTAVTENREAEDAGAEKADADNEAQVPEEAASSTGLEKPVAVSAEDFEIFYNKSRRVLEVKFALKNIDPKESRAAGQVFVVLKSDRLSPNRWLTIPETELVSGKPSGKEPGEVFSISRFKIVRIEAKGQPAPDRFNTATVFIFSETGELMLEKDFPVNTD